MVQVVTGVNVTPQPDKVITINENLGTFITDVDLLPFIKSREINFRAVGLKPTTRVYVFFDGVNVSDWVAQLTKDYGDPLITLADGTIQGSFIIPPNTFTSESIEFTIVDVDNLVTGASTITTRAIATYHGSRLSTSSGNAVLNYSFSVPQTPVIEVTYDNIVPTIINNTYVTNNITNNNTTTVINNNNGVTPGGTTPSTTPSTTPGVTPDSVGGTTPWSGPDGLGGDGGGEGIASGPGDE